MGYRREVLMRCKEDTLFWFENFAWTFDPRKQPSEIPFIPYDGKQVDFIDFLEDLLEHPRDAFVDKPRDVGATTLIMNFLLKHYLFDKNFNARIGSRKEDYVDRTGDPDTLFFKSDYTFNRLPDWMKPDGWNENFHRGSMRMTRPDNTNTLVGESANPNFARGGRQTVVFFDEIGFWPYARSAWESAGDVTNIRIAMTTPPETGKSSHAYKLFSQQAGKVDVFEFDYTDIPWKTKEWVAEQRERRSDEEFEREILKSYSGTTEGKVYAADWKLHVKEANVVEYDPLLPLFIAWDFGLDTTAMIWFQKDWNTNKVRIIDTYSNVNKSPDYYIPFVTGTVISGIGDYTQEELDKIALHATWKKEITHFGDPDVKKRSYVDKRSAFSVLKDHKIYINSKDWAGRSHRDLREKAKLLMRRLEVNDKRCDFFIDCMLSARYPQQAETSQATGEKDKPIHDWTSHFRSAFEYFADNEPFKRQFEDTGSDDKKRVQSYKPMGGYR